MPDDDVSREEFTSLGKRVGKLEKLFRKPKPTGATGATGATGSAGTGTPVPATPVGPDANGVTLTPPVVQASGSIFTVTADVTTTSAVTFRYLQIAIRGTGASDTAFKPNTSVPAASTTRLAGSGSGSGAMSAYTAYSLDGSTWVDGPATAFTLTPGAPSTAPASPSQDTVPISAPTDPASGTGGLKVARVGKSGLPWNQLVFRGTPQEAENWGKARGLTIDGYLFFTTRQTWPDLRSLWGSGHRAWLESGRIIVVTLPVAPESEGDAMNSKGASNAYRQQQIDLGKWYADQGFNRPNAAFRVGWEMNGNWYRWSCNRPGGVDAYRQSIRNFVDNMRAGGLTKATFSQCWNAGPGQSSNGLEAFAGSQWIDVVGIDQYDMWGPSRNAGEWANKMNVNPSAKYVAELAAREGIQWSWDEGGNTHGSGPAYGGDNPYYYTARNATLRQYAANLAWDDCYDERGAPATLKHDFASNPQSDAEFVGCGSLPDMASPLARRGRPMGMFETEVIRMIDSGTYTQDELHLLSRSPWQGLSEEGRWVHTMLIQAAYEVIEQSR